MVECDDFVEEHKVYIIDHGGVIVWCWEVQCWLDVANVFASEVPYKATCKGW